MSRPLWNALRLGTFGCVVVASLLVAPTAGSARDGATRLLPDLKMRRPADLSLDKTEISGRTLLRLTTSVLNRGAGPLEMRPEARDCDQDGETSDDRTAYQIVYVDENEDGWFDRAEEGDSFDTRAAGCQVFHASPDHNHWHFEDFASYALRAIDPEGTVGKPVSPVSDKVSFCLVDSLRGKRLRLGSPASGHYGVGDNRCAQDEVTGISVGWIDVYSSSIDDQWVDVTDVAPGTYCLRATVDPTGRLEESNELNNSRGIRVALTKSSVEYLPRRRCVARSSARG